MKLTFLGTAAAEGFPAVFCNCEFCREARREGGKSIRTRSQALVNSDLLIDLPADTYYHFLNNGIVADGIKYLLITHPHSDHFYPDELEMRQPPFAHAMKSPRLTLVCAEKTAKLIKVNAQTVDPCIIREYETVVLGDYEITALPARHMRAGDTPYIYIIKGEKTLLYAHDTGYLLDGVFEYIGKNGIRLDMISLDCTNVTLTIGDDGGHMGLENNVRVLERLRSIGAVTENTVAYVNHFSHNGNPLHSRLVPIAKELGFEVSYDGLTVEF